MRWPLSASDDDDDLFYASLARCILLRLPGRGPGRHLYLISGSREMSLVSCSGTSHLTITTQLCELSPLPGAECTVHIVNVCPNLLPHLFCCNHLIAGEVSEVYRAEKRPQEEDVAVNIGSDNMGL